MNDADAPLSGLVVVEAGSYITAPFAAQMLAQLGARVIKIEPPKGDPFRRFSHRHKDLSAAWVNVNQGKESVVLDLKTPGGVSRAEELLAGADVFLQNWRPGVAASLGLDPDRCVERHPRLVYVSISGFGNSGPNAAAPVFDTILQAASGLAVLESRTERPAALRSYIADKTTATYAVQAVLAALYKRERTGRGGRVDLAMLDVMAHFNFPDLFQERTFLDEEQHPVSAPPPSAIMRTLDGHVCIAPVQGRHIMLSAMCVDRPEWVPHLKATPASELIAELVGLMETETRSRTTAECLQLFSGAGVPAVDVLGPDEHLHDAQTVHNLLYDETLSPVGRVRRVRYPAVVDGQTLPPVRSAPALKTTNGWSVDSAIFEP